MNDIAVGEKYRIRRLITKERKVRDSFIALGLIPGSKIEIVKRLYGGQYWVIDINGQMIGLRAAELQQLQLYELTEC